MIGQLGHVVLLGYVNHRTIGICTHNCLYWGIARVHLVERNRAVVPAMPWVQCHIVYVQISGRPNQLGGGGAPVRGTIVPSRASYSMLIVCCLAAVEIFKIRLSSKSYLR